MSCWEPSRKLFLSSRKFPTANLLGFSLWGRGLVTRKCMPEKLEQTWNLAGTFRCWVEKLGQWNFHSRRWPFPDKGILINNHKASKKLDVPPENGWADIPVGRLLLLHFLIFTKISVPICGPCCNCQGVLWFALGSTKTFAGRRDSEIRRVVEGWIQSKLGRGRPVRREFAQNSNVEIHPKPWLFSLGSIRSIRFGSALEVYQVWAIWLCHGLKIRLVMVCHVSSSGSSSFLLFFKTAILGKSCTIFGQSQIVGGQD